MRVIILAAGRGSRMKGFTQDRPKCLTLLAGQPLISWQMRAIARAGMGPVTVVGGYRHDQLSGYGQELLVNERWRETNMVWSLCQAAGRLAAEPCLVAYADIVYRSGHLCALAAAKGGLAVLYDKDFQSLWRARFGDTWLDDAETFGERDGRLFEIGGKTREWRVIQGQYMGLLRFTPDAWAETRAVLDGLGPAADTLEMTGLLSLMLARGADIRALPVRGGWCEVDSPADTAVYEAALARGDWRHDWREAGEEPT